MYKPNSGGTLEESGDAGLDGSGSDSCGDDDGLAGNGDQEDSEPFEEDGGHDRERVSERLEREPESGEDNGTEDSTDSSGDDCEGEEDGYEDDEPDVEDSGLNEGEAHHQSGVMMQSIYPGSNVTVLGAYCLAVDGVQTSMQAIIFNYGSTASSTSTACYVLQAICFQQRSISL